MPLYIKDETGGGGPIPALFKIASFINDHAANEQGSIVSDVAFSWYYANGTPTEQSISPIVGSIPVGQKTYSLSGQSISTDTVFTLSATDGVTSRTATTNMKFYYPIYYGSVSSNLPSMPEILAMTTRVGEYTSFTASLNISNAHSCFTSPMIHKITDIREKTFGLSIWSTYTVIDNFYITMLDGVSVACRVVVKNVPEDTLGQTMQLDVVF